MFTEERYNIILTQLKIKKIVSVSELVDLLGASESTVRRDLNTLDSMKELKKIHGGAIVCGDDMSRRDYNVDTRQNLNVKEKDLIAKRASEIIKDGDVIYLDSGTSIEALVDNIQCTDITVVTNGIMHVKKLLKKNIKTILLGGEVKFVTEAVIGSSAVEDIKKYNFSKGFFGTNGVSNSSGYTTPDINEAMVKKEALRRCKDAYILADGSKIEEVSFVTFADISEASLITLSENIKGLNYDTSVIGVDNND